MSGFNTFIRRNPILTFLAKESPSSLPESLGQTPKSFQLKANRVNPFAPYRVSPEQKGMTGPRYSIRRQKDLYRAVYKLGWPREVLPEAVAPSVKNFLNRLYQEKPETPSNAQPLMGTPYITGTRIIDALKLERKGPYKGRQGSAFKGKKFERTYLSRQLKLKGALEKADARIEKYRKDRAADKLKEKKLPF